MMKNTALFFVVLMFIGNAHAVIGTGADKREVIGWIGNPPDYINELPNVRNIWNTPPYSSIVQIRSGGSSGTGEFISPRHILTNAHVAQECGTNGKTDCKIYTSNNQELSAHEVFYGVELTDTDGKFDDDKWKKNRSEDWAILEVAGDYCHKEYRNLQKADATMDNLWRAGFGGLRVLTPSDVSAMVTAYKTYLMLPKKAGQEYEKFFEKFKELTGKDFITDYTRDGNTLKIIKNCSFAGPNKKSYNTRNIVKHSCYAWLGDSGSGIKDMTTNDLVGLDQAATAYITLTNEKSSLDEAILTYKIYSPDIQAAIEKSTASCTNPKPTSVSVEQQPIIADLKPEQTPVISVPEPIKPTTIQEPEKIIQEPVKIVAPKQETVKPEPIKEPTKRELWGPCLASDLAEKPHATAGRYIPNGLKNMECEGGKLCACAATDCENGWYLAASAKGTSNGYCRSGKCPKGKHAKIINGNLMIGCVKD